MSEGWRGEETPLVGLLSLKGRVAVVTGGLSGIGAAIVRRYVEAGASVVVGDIRAHEGQPEAQDHPHTIACCSVDMRQPEAAETLVTAAVTAFGRLDIWVNNAGIYPLDHLVDLGDAAWDDVISLNLTAAFRGARAAARYLIQQETPGVIINIASTAAMAAGPGSAHYVASKHALVGLTKSLAVELSPMGIRAVGIAPGITNTEGLANASAALAAGGWGDLEDYVARTTPLQRVAEPDEIARVAVFAASDLAQYVTGTTILVDGGRIGSLR